MGQEVGQASKPLAQSSGPRSGPRESLESVPREDRPIRVSSFSTILTEVAQRVGGDRVRVHSHIPPGADPHDFEPTPRALRVVSESEVVLLSAKHLEGYAGKLREVAPAGVRIVEVGAQLPSLYFKSGPQAHTHAHAHPHSGERESGKLPRIGGAEGGQPPANGAEEDPHWWHSVGQMQRAVRVVLAQFIQVRPAERAGFEANAARYLQELENLQRWAKARVAELPRGQRKLVTSHDALQYFAKDYGFTVYAVEGLTPSEQPSSRRVAELLEVIRQQRVKAVFAQDTVNPKVLRQITAETGAVMGGRLWVDGLGTGEAGTYEGMFRSNVNAIVEALK
jgi:zinc/manganese transport system substrate-binding protein